MIETKQRDNKLVKPFLKWVGGKRQLLRQLVPHIPTDFSTYYEPFVGGGAVLFHLQPPRAVLNDTNAELINVFRVIQAEPEALIADLERHRNEADYFYEVRGWDRDRELFAGLTAVQRASRTIFLNKTCYNGLYRVNSAGQFNAPFGRYKNPNIANAATIRAVSRYLSQNDITICHGDYRAALAPIEQDGFVYFDPPYDPVSDSANFTSYTRTGFDRADQKQLKATCDWLHRRGVKFLLSNSATPFIKTLYQEYTLIEVAAKRNVNANVAGRGKVAEVLVKNYG